MTVQLPNIRKLFVPDPGYMLFEADLSGADAQVVAWEADDHDLKAAFRLGIKIHEKNAIDLFGERYTKAVGDRQDSGSPKGKIYKQTKTAVHATNYGASAFALSRNPQVGWPLHQVESFQRSWFTLHSGVRDWHSRQETELRTRRTATNRFGYRIIYFDRIDGLLPQALAWVPQSTVALVCFKGALALKRAMPFCEILLQVHDSVVFQVPFAHAERYSDFHRYLSVAVPYPDPLTIPWTLSKSEVSWGDCKEVKL